MHGVIHRQIVTDAAQHDDARLREGLIQTPDTARHVRADSAYRSAGTERWLKAYGMTSQVHQKELRGRPMPQRTSRDNGRQSAVRSEVERVFARQEARMDLTIRTIGLARARAAITLVNIVHDMNRLQWLQGTPLPTRRR